MLVMERIQAEVDTHAVVLFMKGTPQFPMCGFSSRAVQALMTARTGPAGAEAVQVTPAGDEPAAERIHTINVLQEPEIRANLPRFSNWPTFPQLFIHGELIGGCDITLELFESGELQRIVSEALET
ncbi:MAG: glutaredoxin [Pseudoxanthomonas sp.]